VAYVAQLARLELDEAELGRIQADMEEIIDYVKLLGELDVDGIEPTANASAMTNVWREDVAVPSPGRDLMLQNAPATLNGELVKVPRVLPSEEV